MSKHLLCMYQLLSICLIPSNTIIRYGRDLTPKQLQLLYGLKNGYGKSS